MDIQKKLVSLNKLQTESLDDDNALHYNAILRDYLLSYPLGKPNNSYASKLVWEITNRKDFAQKFIFMCVIKNFVMEQYHSLYRETLVATKELIAELNMHSNSK